MRVILLKDVPGIGKKWEIKSVSDGHARNLLIPKRLAEEATSAKVQRVETLKHSLDAERDTERALLLKNLEALKEITLELTMPANEQGHLFKGIHAKELVAALREHKRLEIPEECIQLEQPIKAVGEHDVPFEIAQTKATFKVKVAGKSI